MRPVEARHAPNTARIFARCSATPSRWRRGARLRLGQHLLRLGHDLGRLLTGLADRNITLLVGVLAGLLGLRLGVGRPLARLLGAPLGLRDELAGRCLGGGELLRLLPLRLLAAGGQLDPPLGSVPPAPK
jgi:hypothetical protein